MTSLRNPNYEILLAQFMDAVKASETSASIMLQLYSDARWFEVRDVLQMVRQVAANIVDFQIQSALAGVK